MSEHNPGTGADWREVVDALDALGASIGRATRAAVSNEENRARMRELRDGLSALADRLSDSLGEVAASPEGRAVRDAAVTAAGTVAAAGAQVAEELRPAILDAVRAANEKFKQAADNLENQPAPATTATWPPADAAPAAAAPTAGAPTPEASAGTEAAPASSPAPEPSVVVAAPAAPVAPAPDVAPAVVPVVAPAPAPVAEAAAGGAAAAGGLVEMMRAVNDRFAAERKAAEEAARAAAPEPFLPPETPEDVPGYVPPVAEVAVEPAPVADDASPAEPAGDTVLAETPAEPAGDADAVFVAEAPAEPAPVADDEAADAEATDDAPDDAGEDDPASAEPEASDEPEAGPDLDDLIAPLSQAPTDPSAGPAGSWEYDGDPAPDDAAPSAPPVRDPWGFDAPPVQPGLFPDADGPDVREIDSRFSPGQRDD